MKTFTPASSDLRDVMTAIADAIKYATGDNNSCEIVEDGTDYALVVKNSSGNNLAAFATGAISSIGISAEGTYTWNGGGLTQLITYTIAGSTSNVELYGTGDAFYVRQSTSSGSYLPLGLAICNYSTDCKVFVRVSSMNQPPVFKSGGFDDLHSYTMPSSYFIYDPIQMSSFGTFPLFLDLNLNDVSGGVLKAVFLSSARQGYYKIGQDDYYYLINNSYENFLIKDSFS